MFAPMPKAKVITAMAVNPGLFASIRNPKVMSFQKILHYAPTLCSCFELLHSRLRPSKK